MILSFLRDLLIGRPTTDGAIPPGRRVYAIGDIHGRADLLDRMAVLIGDDLAARPVREATIVTLGDYLDRGPDSARVLDRLARGDLPAPLVALRGNHDDLFLQAFDGAIELDALKRLGGAATLAAYGLDLGKLRRLDDGAIHRHLAAAIPPRHVAFLRATGFSHTIGGYFFCHAGIRPGVALDAQTPDDLMWIREAFLEARQPFPAIVVHGHTPTKAPQVRRNRIGVDTKAFASGTLTALVLEGRQHRFLQT